MQNGKHENDAFGRKKEKEKERDLFFSLLRHDCKNYRQKNEKREGRRDVCVCVCVRV